MTFFGPIKKWSQDLQCPRDLHISDHITSPYLTSTINPPIFSLTAKSFFSRATARSQLFLSFLPQRPNKKTLSHILTDCTPKLCVQERPCSFLQSTLFDKRILSFSSHSFLSSRSRESELRASMFCSLKLRLEFRWFMR